MLHVGAASANELGQFEVANRYWKRMPFQEPGVNAGVYAADLNTTVTGLKRQKEKRERAEKVARLLEINKMLSQAGEVADERCSAASTQQVKCVL